MKPVKKYRFFYHYYKQYKCMSVHYKGVCYRTDNVICNAPCETKWNKTQPQLVLRGFASNVTVTKDSIIIE